MQEVYWREYDMIMTFFIWKYHNACFKKASLVFALFY